MTLSPSKLNDRFRRKYKPVVKALFPLYQGWVFSRLALPSERFDVNRDPALDDSENKQFLLKLNQAVYISFKQRLSDSENHLCLCSVYGIYNDIDEDFAEIMLSKRSYGQARITKVKGSFFVYWYPKSTFRLEQIA